MQTLRHERRLYFGLPAAVLLLAFAAVCLQTRTLWPVLRVVHEDGQHTLLETIFYFEHATRELPLDLVLGVAVAGSVRFFYPPGRARSSAPAGRRSPLLRWFALGTLAMVAAILGGAWLTVGPGGLLDNLCQMHTRPGAPLLWGAHWRYHLLERLATMCLAFAAMGFREMLSGRSAPAHPRSPLLFVGALGVFAALTLLFRPTWEPFREATFLGHQARELFTHTLVTLPLAMGTTLWLAGRVAPEPSGDSAPRPRWPVWAAATTSVLLGGILAVGSVLTGARSAGLTKSLAGLIFPHFFEHTFSYLVVPLVAGLFYLWPGRTGEAPARDVA